ncbi:hypothetical protein BH23PLA1_BH23PLA1_08920 [soil metagenome]
MPLAPLAGLDVPASPTNGPLTHRLPCASHPFLERSDRRIPQCLSICVED